MPKGNKLFAAQSSNKSDDDDSTSSELEVKEKFDKIFISAMDKKSKAKASPSKRKKPKEGNSNESTESEIEYRDSLKFSRTLENVVTKTKVKKRKREEVSSDGDSSGKDAVYSGVIKNVYNKVSDKPRKKLKRKEKDKTLDQGETSSYKTVHKFENVTHKQVQNSSESDNSSSNESQPTSTYNNKHVSFLEVKKELLSEHESEVEEDEDNNNDSVNELINISALKTEQESQCSSDSEIEDDSDNIQSLQKRPSDNTSTLTILQDIRLTPKTQTVYERLKEHFGDLQPLEITADLEFSDSDEVSTLRIPRNADLKLKHLEINPDRRCKINLGEKYVMEPTTSLPNPNYIVSTNSRIMNFKNVIKMEKYNKSKSNSNVSPPEKATVPLPEDLKNRHPLFGSNFQQNIILTDEVDRKLDEAIANVLKREKKAKKKKNKVRKDKNKDKEDTDYSEILNLFSSQNSLAPDNIKKEGSDDSAFGSSSSTDKSKGKKKLKVSGTSQQIKQELETMDNDVDERVVKSSKKKKSKTTFNDQDWLNVSGIKQETADTVDHNGSKALSKAEKKRLSIINSTLMADVLKTPKFNPNVSSIASDASTSGKKSKKSKKHKNPYDEVTVKKEQLISDLLRDISMEINVPNAIKKET